MELKLEVLVVPVADVDGARDFYQTVSAWQGRLAPRWRRDEKRRAALYATSALGVAFDFPVSVATPYRFSRKRAIAQGSTP